MDECGSAAWIDEPDAQQESVEAADAVEECGSSAACLVIHTPLHHQSDLKLQTTHPRPLLDPCHLVLAFLHIQLHVH